MSPKPAKGLSAPAPAPTRGAVPLYHQLFLSLQDEILSGKRRLGALLPTEMELCSIAGVSRITARRALTELEASGLVERRRRLGTRVTFQGAPKPIEADIKQAIDALVAFGRGTTAEVLSISETPADQDTADLLEIKSGDTVIKTVRLRSLDNQPLGRVTSFARTELRAFLTEARLSSTPILEILRRSGFQIGSARQKIMATLAPSDLAAQLQIDQRAPILRVQRLIYERDRRPILLTVAEYRADRYHVVVDLVGDLEEGAAPPRPG